MRHALKRAGTVGAVLALSFALAACGGGDDGGDEGAGGQASGEVTVWAMGAEGEKLGQIAKDFTAENPDIKVNVTPIAWDVAHDKLLTAVAGGQTPDVSQLGTTWMGEFAKTGALEEVPDDIDLNQFFEGAKNTAVVDETPYGVPWYVETRLLYYRSDIAKKAGVAEPPGNWDELMATAKAMKEKGGARYGIALAPNNWQEFLPFVWQTGGEVVDDSGQFTFDTPEVKEALTYYKSFFDENLASPSVPEGFAVEQGFIAGTHPMFFSGPWHMSILEDQGGADLKGKWDIAPMPEKDTATSFVGGSDLVVFKDSDNKEAAWEFVRYLLQPEVQQKWYATVSALPSVESAWDKAPLSTDKHLMLFGEQLQDAKSPPPHPKWEQVAVEAVNTELEKAVTGNSSVDEAAKAMQEKATAVGAAA
jgi:multiple sugar transport system substrate-binding protein